MATACPAIEGLGFDGNAIAEKLFNYECGQIPGYLEEQEAAIRLEAERGTFYRSIVKQAMPASLKYLDQQPLRA